MKENSHDTTEKQTMTDAEEQTNNLNAFGFDTPLAKRNIIIAFIAFLIGLLGVQQHIFHKENIKKDQEIASLKIENKELQNEFKLYLKEYAAKQELHQKEQQEQIYILAGLRKKLQQVEKEIQ